MPSPVFYPAPTTRNGERQALIYPSTCTSDNIRKYRRCPFLARSCDSRCHRRSRYGLSSYYSVTLSSQFQGLATPSTPSHRRVLIPTVQTRLTRSLPTPLLRCFPPSLNHVLFKELEPPCSALARSSSMNARLHIHEAHQNVTPHPLVTSSLSLVPIFVFVCYSGFSYQVYPSGSSRQRSDLSLPRPHPFRNAFPDYYLSRCGA